MRFAEIFATAERPVLSFEIFPPKTPAGLERLYEHVIPRLKELAPRFMSVTYGAGGSTQALTLEIAAHLKQEERLETACHLTCVGASRSQLDDIICRIRDSEIENIVAIRGDPPRGQSEFVPAPDGLSHGNELVEHIRRLESREGLSPAGIVVAGYPEKHLEAPDMQTDLSHLKRKVETGADVVVTQLFFDNRHYFEFLEKARAIGITVPIVPGLLPIQSVRQIRRFTSLCGATIPDGLQARLDTAVDDDERARKIGIEHCALQACELLEKGVPGIHFYVLNRAIQMQKILPQLPL